MGEQFEGVYKIIAYVVSTIVLVTLGILFWTHPLIFWTFAFFLFACLILLIADFTSRRVTRFTHFDVGENSTVAQNIFGRVKVFEPHAPRVAAPREKQQALIPVIPKVADLLRDGLLDGKTLYHGYAIVKEEAQPSTGTFNDLRTFAIGGKGGSGKTVRLFFLLLQFILGHATVYLCDPHGEDPESISAMVRPLARWIHFAITDYQEDIDEQVMHSVVEFRDVMEGRKHGDKDRTPKVLVIDEFTSLLNHPEYGEIVVDVVCKCATEYRKFQGYAVVIAQEWTAPGKGKVMNLLSRLRNDLHAIFIHRLNRNYAKLFLSDVKLLKRVDHLRPGQCFFLDANGSEVQEIFTPMGTVADAFTVARMMQQIERSDEMLQLSGGRPYEVRDISPEYSSPQMSNIRLLERPEVRGENMVREPEDGGESGEKNENPHHSREDEEAIVHAYVALQSEEKKITKQALIDYLHGQDVRWNNKKWNVVREVCEKYSLC